MDIFTAKKRSEIMSLIHNKNTKPEIIVRSILHKNGFRFRIQDKSLPGRPDIILKKYHTVVFINGCFWHGHSCRKRKIPKSNRDYWRKKINGNIARDKKNVKLLRKMGWSVIIIWSCELTSKVKVNMTMAQLILFLRTKRLAMDCSPDKWKRRKQHSYMNKVKYDIIDSK